jgi:hypothetical protein
VEEFDGAGVAAVLAADADLQVAPTLAPLPGSHLHQLADAIAVEDLERVVIEDTGLDIEWQERCRVVARDAVRGLREVVRAEREELRLAGDVRGHQRGARQLDHGAHQEWHVHAALGEYRLRHAADERALLCELALVRHQRHHDLGQHAHAFLGNACCGLEDRARLHLGDLGIRDAEPDAAVAEHGIRLTVLLHQARHVRHRDAGASGELGHLLAGSRQELVQRRVQQSHRHGVAVHGPEDALEVPALHGQQLAQRGATRVRLRCEDHLAHRLDVVALEEHVFGAAQADAFGAELARPLCVRRSVRVRAHPQHAQLVGPLHQLVKLGAELRLDGRDLPQQDAARRAVHRDPVTLADHQAIAGAAAGLVVNAEGARSHHAALAHAARDDGGV